jgi:hypothetical protein
LVKPAPPARFPQGEEGQEGEKHYDAVGKMFAYACTVTHGEGMPAAFAEL